MTDDNDDDKRNAWGADHGPSHEQTTNNHIHNDGMKDGGAQAHLGYIPQNNQTDDAKHPESEKKKKEKDDWELIKHLKRIEDDLRQMMDELADIHAEIRYRNKTISLLEKAKKSGDVDTAKDILVVRCGENVEGLSEKQVWDKVASRVEEEKISVKQLEQRVIQLEDRIQKKIDDNPELDANLRQEFSERLEELKQDGLDGGLSETEVGEAMWGAEEYYNKLSGDDNSLIDDNHRTAQEANNAEVTMLEENNPFAAVGNITSSFNKASEGVEMFESNQNLHQPSSTPDVPTMA